MKRSTCLRSPVVSLFSSSAASSRLAQEVLRNLFPTIEPSSLLRQDDELDDELDQALKLPGLSRRWDSVASKCVSSGTIFHFLSLTSNGSDVASTNENRTGGHLSLLGVTNSQTRKQSDADSVQESRRLIASHVCTEDGRYLRSLRLIVKHAAGRHISVSDIIGFGAGLPLLYLPMNDDLSSIEPKSPRQPAGLKEIAIPHYDDGKFPDGQTLLSMLGSSTLHRPAVGLYQWPNHGVAIRPLPSAKEDRILPAPSLVFYCEDLDQAADTLSTLGAVSAKIGYNGLQNSGQLMVSHPNLLGLDIRLTDSTDYTSSYPEAQEALLASSLAELQNANVLLEGGKENKATRAQMDERVNAGDCWVEFRANMKRPLGFVNPRVKSGGRVRRIAKAPDLPYE